MESEIRFCEDIGMFTQDRPRTTCLHRTSFCASKCYNIAIEIRFDCKNKDTRNEVFWQWLDGDKFKAIMDRKKKDTSRFRFMTRGEAISTESDVYKIKDIATKNPNIDFWLPTRAWRDAKLWSLVVKELDTIKNIKMSASIDPSNKPSNVKRIMATHSTMFFGDDNELQINGIDRFLCPKTHSHKLASCNTCKDGCFSNKKVHVHLKQH